MTTLDAIRDSLPDYARDLRLNLGSVLTPAGAPGLSERQIWAIALAAAIASRHVPLARDIEALAAAQLSAAELNAARAAAAVMGMNKEDAQYRQLPARLRMNVLANPGIDKQDFELLSLAVSAINGCGTCIASHERQLRQHGMSREAVQSVVRIATTIHAVAGVLEFESQAAGVAQPHAA